MNSTPITNYNQIIINKSLAKKVLDELGLPLFGKMHPEKFYKKLVTFLDLSNVEFKTSSESNSIPSSTNLFLNALRPDSLPNEILLSPQPTSCALMIS